MLSIVLPSQSDGEAADVEVQRHYVSQDLERETEGQRRLCRGERQSDELQANAGDAEEVQLLLEEDEAEDPSTPRIARHLK